MATARYYKRVITMTHADKSKPKKTIRMTRKTHTDIKDGIKTVTRYKRR